MTWAGSCAKGRLQSELWQATSSSGSVRYENIGCKNRRQTVKAQRIAKRIPTEGTCNIVCLAMWFPVRRSSNVSSRVLTIGRVHRAAHLSGICRPHDRVDE
ncbi:hypothetical protein E2C01_035452 [Portunus trituberculatus]|uniref:Uncharacterized protein n=1 Tax=Portunus trituberculatus TaxID=210409 RepID=A0A5B7F8D4_PORTR|nr:hypothetical protein [Portunus trituberculatus]